MNKHKRVHTCDERCLTLPHKDSKEEKFAFEECLVCQHHINYIEGIRYWLRNLAEDRTIPMDVKVYELLWNQIQSIDHDIKTKFEGEWKE